MERILYLEGASGISGDMTVAALLDLGADREKLEKALASLPVEGARTEISRVKKSGLDCCDFRVILDEAHENHDHDMEYLHGHDHPHEHDHGHGHDHSHEHEHGNAHHHMHRGLPEILDIIGQADLEPAARELASRIFRILGEAEAKAHGVPLQEVHFHEVGAVDSIIDIVASAVCLTDLGVKRVVVPPLAEGHGTIRCQHGIIPVPVPAVVNIVSSCGLALRPVDTEGELVTPTGAAIAAAVRTDAKLPEAYRILKTGLGAGKRQYNRPSLLRAMLLEVDSETEEQIVKLETNVDDCTGEALGHVMEVLFAAGARDVYYTPVYMKKNRPAWQISVICMEEKRQELEHILFAQTSTIGIRRAAMERTVMDRRIEKTATPWGEARIKISSLGELEKAVPEYEDVKKISLAAGIPWQEAYESVLEAWKKSR